MKVLHVTPHLGGGVGKAHAAISAVLPKTIEQTFVLLEPPRDRSFADTIEAGGARVIVADDLDQVARLAGVADIVQFEFWNHPRLFECLARCEFAALRSVFWSHISGLSQPVIQPALVHSAGRFVLTTEASLSIPSIVALRQASPRNIDVINSGFGFSDAPSRAHPNTPSIAYLGTVDFVKMHPFFFEVIDRLAGDDIRVSVWGAVDPASEVTLRAQDMRHPERIAFCGQTAEPALALSGADIFFYPLQADHYGTAENALIEAMSLGLAPVVLNNPAEVEIVRAFETGLVAHCVEQCVSMLQLLLSSAELRTRIGQAAARDVAEKRTPELSARKFVDLWGDLLDEPAKRCDFRSAVGETPADWFLATQQLPGTPGQLASVANRENASKGTLAHFESVFAGDASLARLRQAREVSGRRLRRWSECEHDWLGNGAG